MARENSPSRDARRRGKNASTLNSETPPRPSVPLGDIIDLYAYVAKIARSLTSDEDEFEDLLGEGVTLACERAKRLAPGESASSALAFWLESRLRDERRKRHPEWRRNSRGGTAYSLQVPTGLAWEQDTTTVSMPARADGELI